MAFADEAVKDGRGSVYRIDISLNSFSTIAYRYSTQAGVDGSNEYDPRIVRLGRLTRALGPDHLVAAGQIEVALANDDEGVDWMLAPAEGPNVLKARARLYIGLFDPADTARPPTITWKQLGEFVISGFPRRDQAIVRIVLADDVMGWLEHTDSLPTLKDWYDQDASSSTNPMRQASTFPFIDATGSTAMPLSWGKWGNIVPAMKMAARPVFTGSKSSVPFAVCVTTSTAAYAADDVGFVFCDHGGVAIPVPATWSGYTLWTAGKSATLTKGSKSFKALWFDIDAFKFAKWAFARGYIASESDDLAERELLQRAWAVGGGALSGRVATDHTNTQAVDIVEDIVSHYCKLSSSYVDSSSFARVRSSGAASAALSGAIHPRANRSDNSLRQHLSEIAGSGDIDVFAKWDGTIGVACRNLDYTSQTATLVEIDETHVTGVEEFIPSGESRGAPYNRLYMTGGNPPNFGAGTVGPWDDPGGTVSAWGRPVPRTLQRSWLMLTLAEVDPWKFRNVEAGVRPKVGFTTGREGLLLELGDFFLFNWTRGLGTSDPYSSTPFQVEELSLDPSNDTVRVTATYAGDLRSTLPYLLDNETLHVIATGSGARTAEVDDSSTGVTFSSGDLTAEGVRTGDILLLLDTSLGGTTFSRYRALRISSVVSATQLEIDDADLDFDTGGTPVAVSQWELRRGVRNLEHLDPGDYSDGVTMYGAASDTSGTYSDGSTAHRLLEG